MEPQVGQLAPDEATAGEVASPEWVGGSILAALLLGVLVWEYVRRTTPPLPLPPPREVEHVEHVEHVPERIEARPPAPEVAPPPAVAPPVGLFALLRDALGRSRDVLRGGFDRIFGRPIDESSLEALEEALLRADVGVQTTDRLLGRVRDASRAGVEGDALRQVLADEMRGILDAVHAPLAPAPGLWVVLVVGVNGSGKTTTIGKLAARLKGEGRKVLLAAGDTFRAAAEQQLGIWAERAGVDLVALEEGADPGAVAFTAVERAKKEGHDVVIVDTAGRLQTKKPLMEQLGKIRRVLDKAHPGAPHETLLVLDGTMGQNGMSQARLFHEATPLTGVVVTKLDGTAKGGMILAIATELKLPVKLIGLGEKVGDLRDFDPKAFVDALVQPEVSDPG